MRDDCQANGFVLEGFRIGGAANAPAVLLASMGGDISSFRSWTPGVELEDGSAEMRVIFTVLNNSPFGRALPRNVSLFTVSFALCRGCNQCPWFDERAPALPAFGPW